MQGKIALEEHFAIEESLADSEKRSPVHAWPELRARLLDLHEQRLRLMDAHGIEITVLSLNSPTVQATPDTAQAAALARRANDFLAEQVARRPARFQAFAALPMQDPDLASAELERCVKDFGFKGAMVNGFSQIDAADTALYYDLPQYRPFWHCVECLDVPFFLHPRLPLPRDARIYDGHPWLQGAAWSFGQETAVHALRLICSGLFDAHPGVQIVIGHLGEGIPYNLWRLDNCNLWWKTPGKYRYPAQRSISEYFCANFHVVTSGNFSTPSLLNAMLVVGADRIMFSTDWPFENIDHAAEWFDSAPISEADRLKIGRSNALKLFKLDSTK